MSLPSRILERNYLEHFLFTSAELWTTHIAQGFSPAGFRNVQICMIEVIRYYLAGFSKDQILEDCSSSNAGQIYDMVAELIPKYVLEDEKSGDRFTVATWDACSALGLGREISIDAARTLATAKPVMAFVDGDYNTCALAGVQGAAAFGRHIFYQMSIIGNIRMGKLDDASLAYKAANTALEFSSPWHSQLIDLTCGQILAKQLISSANDNDKKFQVSCFEGLRAFSSEDMEYANRILSSAATKPNDLPIELMLVTADLDRLKHYRNTVLKATHKFFEKYSTSWDHQAWLEFLSEIRGSIPDHQMSDAEVGRLLEGEAEAERQRRK